MGRASKDVRQEGLEDRFSYRGLDKGIKTGSTGVLAASKLASNRRAPRLGKE